VDPRCGGRIGDGGLLPALCRPALQPGLAHQPGDPLTGMAAALSAQLRMHPRRPVTALRVLMHLLDLAGQLDVLPPPCGGLVPPRCVIGGTGRPSAARTPA